MGLWILPHTAGWGRYWLRLFMTTVFQQAVQIIALALGFGFLSESWPPSLTFEPAQDLVWKLLMSLAFVYLATRVPSLLGHHGTFDAWLHTLYFGLSLPGSMMRSARALALVGGPAGAAAAAAATSASAAAANAANSAPRRPPLPPHSPGPGPQEPGTVTAMGTTNSGLPTSCCAAVNPSIGASREMCQ